MWVERKFNMDLAVEYIYPVRKISYCRLHARYIKTDQTRMMLVDNKCTPPIFIRIVTLTLSQCTLAGPLYIGMPLECHWLTQCTLGYHLAYRRILAGYTGTPLEKNSWSCPTLGCHWRNFNFCSLHWNTTGGTVPALTWSNSSYLEFTAL